MSLAHAPIAPPSKWLALTEVNRATVDLGALALAAPWLQAAPRGDGHPVLVLPGFITTDVSTRPLRAYLRSLGYDAHAWKLGRNIGPRSIGGRGEKLTERLREIHEETGRTVSLVGWSLGGVMARELARQAPQHVRQVITLGSPFTGDPRATNVGDLYEALSGERLDDLRLLERRSRPPPVPSTAIWSKADGVVSWRNCIEPASPTTDNIEVRGSHCGLCVNPAVLFAVADRLALSPTGWAPFQRTGWRALVYPSGGHLN